MRSKRKWTDFSLPGYKYLGPGNALDKGQPNNANDQASIYHDVRYGDIQFNGQTPYLVWSEADQKWLDTTTNKDYGGVLGRAFFNTKKALHNAGIIPKAKNERPRVIEGGQDVTVLGGVPQMVPKPTAQFNKRSKIEGGYIGKFSEASGAQTLSNLQENAQPMSGGGGSGNAAGLRETPIDIPDWKHPVSRGPADYAFATLPYYKDRIISTTRTGIDHAFRMTSPYDPEIENAAPQDLNAGTGSATFITVEASDASDTKFVSARWYDFYTSMYKYYHVIGCRWHLTVQNLKTEPVWLHTMYFNDEVPPLGATNEDIQCWNDAQSHLIGPVANAITATGTMETLERNQNLNNVEGAGTAGNVPNFEDGNMVDSKVSNILKLSGTYKPGQKKRQIHLDSEVENWTAYNANPGLPEKLLLRFKPVWNAIDTNDTFTYDRDIRVHYTFKIEYLVEFKELVYGLKWPVERQPAITAPQYNIEEDEE